MYGLVSSFKVQVSCLYYIHYIIIYYISFSQVINSIIYLFYQIILVEVSELQTGDLVIF